MSQQKTKEWVRVPITMEVNEALQGLNFKGEKGGKKFWFFTGNGERKTAINNWRERIQNLFNMAQEDKPFDHQASPHTWRHTFAISHLNNGTDVKMVSRWLGHSSIRIIEAHYGHANRSTHIAAEMHTIVCKAPEGQKGIRRLIDGTAFGGGRFRELDGAKAQVSLQSWS